MWARQPARSRFCAACGNELTPIVAPAALAAPQELRERAGAGAVETAGQRKHATVLFADVAGSMELAERIDAEQWREVMDGLFKLLADGVHRHEGTVDKFTGDGIMALFGAPIADESHARSACLAALEILEKSSAYAERIERDLGIRLAVRIGINSGMLVIGSLGERDDLQYTAIGHTVGLAQRMESLAGPDSILITERRPPWSVATSTSRIAAPSRSRAPPSRSAHSHRPAWGRHATASTSRWSVV